MSPQKAEEIINKYGAALSKGGVARKIGSLPCSRARIRYAYYVYIAALIKEGGLTQKAGEALVTTYSSLSAFVADEEADRINQLMDDVAARRVDLNDPQNQHLREKFGSAQKYIHNAEQLLWEIDEYIAECYELQKRG